MTFMRLKTDSAGRVYLYEEVRTREAGKVKSVSRSHGRVHGFWFAIACLIEGVDDLLRTKNHGYDQEEAERQSLEVQEREQAERERTQFNQANFLETSAHPPAPAAPANTDPPHEAPPASSEDVPPELGDAQPTSPASSPPEAPGAPD